ncbi:MAG: hypothetical protein M0R70_13340 [Nitrospirae bacterium]|nr:hypothetical protein [Nitrospirota bacterium]
MTLEEKLQNLPDSPGVYLMKDGKGYVIYVGKALSLWDRVRSYFQKGAMGEKTERLVPFQLDSLLDMNYHILKRKAVIMRATIKTADAHPARAAILKKLAKSTRAVTASTMLPFLKKKGATELTLLELRKRLSALKTPLSREIIAERGRG